MAMQVNWTEIRIPVPWGFIAGKLWGDPQQEMVLAVHGLQDNANTFDSLLPLLLNDNLGYSFLSIDLPGHGLSSHFPPGRPIYFMDLMSAVHRVIQWMLERQKRTGPVHYVGHSFGGQIGLHLAAVFPECLRKLVVIDALVPVATRISKYFDKYRTAEEKMEELENKVNTSSPPSYTYKEAWSKIKTRFYGDMTDEAASTLLARSSKKVGDRYFFTMDQRLKFVLYHPFTLEQQFELFTKIVCPIEFIVAEESRLAGGDYHAKRMELFKKCSGPCSIYLVEGGHDVHLEHPLRVYPLVKQFLIRTKSSL